LPYRDELLGTLEGILWLEEISRTSIEPRHAGGFYRARLDDALTRCYSEEL